MTDDAPLPFLANPPPAVPQLDIQARSVLSDFIVTTGLNGKLRLINADASFAMSIDPRHFPFLAPDMRPLFFINCVQFQPPQPDKGGLVVPDKKLIVPRGN